ncbi:hypothetical protein [Paraburkholderia sp.]|uniref:hypothetical protein n=1 Tax=Paraburkholderia sp. TaxID=1926495 RepID=UPI0039E6B143
MLTPAAPSETFIARITPIRGTTHTPVPLVVIDVAVPGTSSADARRALHAALGDDLRLYIMTVDRQRECVTFRVEVTSHTLDDVIGLLTAALDRATLGHARAARRGVRAIAQ